MCFGFGRCEAPRHACAERLGSHFISAFLPYFDQYALSHRLWAPDSSSILLPLIDASGREQLVVIPSDGTAGRPVAGGVSGFWRP